MAGCLTEEQVTKSILRWLIRESWEIIAFDFPQSGTGRCLHPDNTASKTDGIWIPDIVAHKNNNLIFFENKARFVLSDFEKVNRLKHSSCYDLAIRDITKDYTYTNVYYGIGFSQTPDNVTKAIPHYSIIDFLVTSIDKDNANVEYDPHNIFTI